MSIDIKKIAQKIFKKWLQQEIDNYRKYITIYDVFTFFDELELLEIRLNMLAPYVDYFVVKESKQTFSGLPKELIFEKNKERFSKFKGKIIHFVTDDNLIDENDLRRKLTKKSLSKLDKQSIEYALISDNVPRGQTHWLRDFYQKELLKKALVNLNDDDICFVGDVDEIWNPRAIIDFRRDDIFKLRQIVYSYFLNNRSNEPWAGTLVTKYKNIKNSCLNHLRTAKKTKYTYVNNGGWHFTNMGGPDQIRKKLESYGHQEYNNQAIKSDIENKIAQNKDFIGRDYKFWLDGSKLPEYIKKNRAKYRHLFK